MGFSTFLDVFWRVVVFGVGLYVIYRTVTSAVYTFVVPRPMPDQLTRIVFVISRRLFDFRLRWAKTFVEKDRIMAVYAPLTMISLPVMWLLGVSLGYTGLYWALGVRPWSAAFFLSESSILTLGFATSESQLVRLVIFSETALGMILAALLISYLPTMYSAFSRRETLVTLLDVRAGNPPSPVKLLTRTFLIRGLEDLNEYWALWEVWFAEVEESHTSLPSLVFYRSPQPEYSWVVAAGTILDAAALYHSTIAVPRTHHAQLCIRAGYLSLRRIADFFRIPYNPAPNPTDPISITRAEFDAAYDVLAAEGLPVVADRDQAWRDFAGWRVNYDTVLLALCGVTMAPTAMWSSDRAPAIKVSLWMRQ